MFGWFHKKEQPQSRYRIRFIEGYGYLPEYYINDLYGWDVIEKNGKDSIPYSVYVANRKACESEEEAGQVINKHSQLFSEGRVIWESNK